MRYRILYIFLLFPLFLTAGHLHKGVSVLASGKWYKISVYHDGIHKITYNDFVNMGFDPATMNTANIRVYGNGGGMLPEANAGARIDDLRENQVQVFDGGDGKMNPGDYIIFYGESPDAWVFNHGSVTFNHEKNLYADSSYYFINADIGPGRRVLPTPGLDSVPNYYSYTFTDYVFHELDSLNIISSGKVWYGEKFDVLNSHYLFSYTFPNIDRFSPVKILTSVAARAPVTSTFYLKEKNGTPIDSLKVEYTDPQSITVYGKDKTKASSHFFGSSSVSLDISYKLYNPSSIGWLNYFEINARRALTWVGPQMPFSDPLNIARNRITEYHLRYPAPDMKVWNISDIDSISEVTPLESDTAFIFRMKTDTIKKFIAFDGSMYYPVNLVGQVRNQNLHGMDPATMVIVTNPLFSAQAERLANFHRQQTDFSVLVVSTSDIYNEFSCGRKELTAIRDFMKLIYDKATDSNKPKYLLLFGDGSYDPKNRVPGNNNMVPTFQSFESLKTVSSYVSDDYYGLMDDNEGDSANGSLDIGIGRFPVTTTEEANIMVDKIFRYAARTDTTQSDWRNVMTFIADDENMNLHLNQAEELTDIVKTKYPVFNVNKIYLDAYKMIQTPSGMRLPEVNQAIDDAVARGTLILNYTGHGGEDGWAAEKVLTVQDIDSWTNRNKMPVFVTATCEFSRFDNPERFTAGERVLLHDNGGAIAIYSTTRLALATSNFKLDTSFFHHLLPENGDQSPKMGDLIRISKNNNGNNAYIRNFALLGDPAQSIAYPQDQVVTTAVNQVPVADTVNDTIKGLSRVTIHGKIIDIAGNNLSGKNGFIYSKVFDKPVTYTTIGNTSDSYPEDFQLQDRLLFDGKTSVSHGEFEFSFVVPKGIGLQYGQGKISYYSRTDTTDATGYYDHIVFGGSDPSVNPVNQGPGITMYLDKPSFTSGDMTGVNPVLNVHLQDDDGINYFNLGIGHEIMAVFDEQVTGAINMNAYYVPTADTYVSGDLQYPLSGLSNGHHTIRLKAWDLYDNSSEKTISFFVFTQPAINIRNVYNYPNPVTEGTTFQFTNIQSSGDLNVKIMIYTFTGQMVRTLESTFTDALKSSGQIFWDGTGEGNCPLANGLYVYRFLAADSHGTVFETSQKLLINK